MIESPAELGLPFPSWRPRQDEMVQEVLNLEDGETLILEAATGYGKSGIAGATSHYRPGTSVLIGTRDLQQQYVNTLPIFKAVWGRSHYPCIHPRHISDFQSVYGVPPTREDCFLTNPQKCDYFSECPYQVAKQDALDARARAFNLHYAFYARWWRDHCADLFCDEAHRLPVVLSDLVSIEMRDSTRQKFSLPPFPLAIGGAPYAIRRAREWAEKCDSHIASYTKSKDIRMKRSAERWRGRLAALVGALGSAEEAEWYIKSKEGDSFMAKPVVPGAFSRSILIPQARSYVLMSATIGDPGVLASELGIENYTFKSYPHIFPAANRPVLFYKDAPRLSYKSPEADYAHQLDLIKTILKSHEGEKGIIHTASWYHARNIAKALVGNGRDVLLPEPSERVRSIERFKKAREGTIAISPSWKEGLDFHDDLARWCIIAKVPFLSLADPIVKLRLQRKGGRAWFDWVAALAIVQSAGRIVRHPTDFGVTHIVDGHWTRVAKRAPRWFEWEKV